MEPYLADVDALVSQLVDRPPDPLPYGALELAQRLDQAGATWAFDGRTALVLHGLAAAPELTEVVFGDSPGLRELLYRSGCPVPCDARGCLTYESWLDVDLAVLVPDVLYLPGSLFAPRFAPTMPQVLRVEYEDEVLPVLSLLDLERAHPGLATVLARLRERRRTVVA